MKLLTRCLLHLGTGLHTICNIKPSRKIKITRRVIKKGCLLGATITFVPFRVYSFRAHIEMLAPPPSPDPTCSNAPPEIKIYQSSKHYQPADIISSSI